MEQIAGTGGYGQAGFTLEAMKTLMYSDIQYGASLVKSQVVAMCRSFPHGLAPTGNGKTIPVGDACDVLAAWNGRENPGSRGSILFSDFWNPALGVPGGPWAHPFQVGDPVHTPYGLNIASLAVQQSFGDALMQMRREHQPYDPQAATVLAYSESDNPSSSHYDDQTTLFSHRQWATAYFTPAQVTTHALSTTVVSSSR